MPTVSRTFVVTPPPAVVLDYLVDFSNAAQWDPGTKKCERLDSGPVVVGSTWHNVSKVAGVETELTYTLKERTTDRLVFVGVNDSAPTRAGRRGRAPAARSSSRARFASAVAAFVHGLDDRQCSSRQWHPVLPPGLHAHRRQ